MSRASIPLVLALSAACSSGPAFSVDGAGDSGSGPADAAAAGDASKPVPDAGASPPAFVTNLPGATVKDVGTPPTPGFVLLSLNFLQEPSGGQTYQQWLGEVQNVGTTTGCIVQIDLTLEDATGAAVVTARTAYADADPYVTPSSTLTEACIAPGKIGGFWTNGFANTAAATADVRTIAVKFGPFTEPSAVPDPNAPVVSAHVQTMAGGYGLAGTITASSGTINNVAVQGYPRDATGLVLGEVSGDDLGTLAPGASYDFTTAPVLEPFTQFRQYASYIEGAGTGGYPHGRAAEQRAASAETAALAARARARR
jgi:hypothetical protein